MEQRFQGSLGRKLDRRLGKELLRLSDRLGQSTRGHVEITLSRAGKRRIRVRLALTWDQSHPPEGETP
jgi:hypothetical protein